MKTTDRRFTVARDLARDLDHACDRARDLARTHVFDLTLAYDLVSASVLAHALARDASNAESARELFHEVDRISALSRDFGQARDVARDLARAHGRASYLTNIGEPSHTRALALTPALELAEIGASASVRANATARTATNDTGHDLTNDAVPQQEHRIGRVTPSAGRLLAAAAQLLPAADRARYVEEYHSELYEIAVAGRLFPRLRQLRYAFWQIVMSRRLRAELLASHWQEESL